MKSVRSKKKIKNWRKYNTLSADYLSTLTTQIFFRRLMQICFLTINLAQ